MTTVLILGSGPHAREAAAWPRAAFDEIVAINNAWQVRPDWSVLIHPEDFPPERRPHTILPAQRIVTADEYVGAQNAYGGFVYAGGTMAFTASYWALHALRPRVIAYFGCDMVYPAGRPTHFYGTGAADPLRKDVTLRSLSAKSCRLQAFAAQQGCALVNLSARETRLTFPRSTLSTLAKARPAPIAVPMQAMAQVLEAERALGYFVASGRYWECEERFDPARIDALDRMWLDLMGEPNEAAAPWPVRLFGS